jgi:hypothetical protein
MERGHAVDQKIKTTLKLSTIYTCSNKYVYSMQLWRRRIRKTKVLVKNVQTF